MKKIKFTKETLGISLILILSAILNFANIAIEGYGNGYYAAGVKSMTMSFRNFFFVSFDPSGFVSIDKPPMGFWIQTIFAKIFGFSGWSVLLPQALAGVISVYLVYYLVRRSFGTVAGMISGLCLAVTPCFVAASRNNTIDNLLVVTLLFACIALTKAAESGKSKYLYISLVLVGIGFNIKMLEAYMIGPAIYITYLLSTVIPLKKRIKHLVIGSIVLFVVSLSWTVIVDLVPAQNRPFVGSSTDNSVMELIIGHNGLERLGLSGKTGRSGGGPGNNKKGNELKQSKNNTDTAYNEEKDNTHKGEKQADIDDNIENGPEGNNQNQGMPGDPPMGNNQGVGNMQPPNGEVTSDLNVQGEPGGQGMSGGPGGAGAPNGGPGNQGGPSGQGMPGGGQNGGPGGGLQGSMGGQTPAGITRLFSKNSLADQIVWFIPLAFIGFLAGVIKEKLRFKLDNKRKVSLVLWFMWFLPEFIYFSVTKGLFHPYYLTMMAPPVAALSGIGITVMWELYKEGKWKSWLLPAAFMAEGLTHKLMVSYFYDNMTYIIKNIINVSITLCFASCIILSILNILNIIQRKNNTLKNSDNLKENKGIKLKKVLVGIALSGVIVTPFIGASAAITHKVNETIPCAGLELLSGTEKSDFLGGNSSNNSNNKLIEFLEKNKTNEKYLLVVSSASSAQDIIINTGESVLALGGFSGSDNILTLDEFKELVANGEVRYVLAGGKSGSSEIMNWVAENGEIVSESEYKTSTKSNNELKDNKNNTANSQEENSNLNIQDANISNNKNSNSGRQNSGGPGGEGSGQLYDLKGAVDTLK